MPFLDNADAVGQLDGLVHVVGDEYDSLFCFFLERMDLVLQLGPGHGIQSGEGLIHQNDGGVHRKGPGYSHALLLPAGQLRGVLVAVGVRVQIDHPEHLSHPLRDPLAGVAGDAHDQRNIFLHGQMGEEAAGLNDIAHQVGQLICFDAVHRRPIDEQLALLHIEQLVDALEKSGFSTAAGADENKKFTVLNGKIHVVQNGPIFVRHGHILKLNHKRVSRSLLCYGGIVTEFQLM